MDENSVIFIIFYEKHNKIGSAYFKIFWQIKNRQIMTY